MYQMDRLNTSRDRSNMKLNIILASMANEMINFLCRILSAIAPMIICGNEERMDPMVMIEPIVPKVKPNDLR